MYLDVEVFKKGSMDRYTLRIKHIRQRDKSGNIGTHGGSTVVVVSDYWGEIYIGTAYCHINDSYDKKKGVVTAVHKILKELYPGLVISSVMSSSESLKINLTEERFWLTV